jgi:hypothetical protein
LFGQHILYSALRENYLEYLESSVGGFPIALYYVVCHKERFPLSPVAFVLGAAVGDVFPLRSLSDFYFL